MLTSARLKFRQGYLIPPSLPYLPPRGKPQPARLGLIEAFSYSAGLGILGSVAVYVYPVNVDIFLVFPILRS